MLIFSGVEYALLVVTYKNIKYILKKKKNEAGVVAPWWPP
jgi:hypothetical protein